MINYFVLFLYIMAYTFSIVAMSLLCFINIRHKINTVKYGLLFNVFLTLSLVFDTIHYYNRMIIINGNSSIIRVIIYGLLFSNIGLSYFLALFTSEILKTRFEKTRKLLFFSSSFIALIIPVLLFFLRVNGVIHKEFALHTSFFLSNIFSSVWALHFTIRLVKCTHKFNPVIRPFIIAFTVLISTLAPLSMFTNLLLYFIQLPFPLAFSPMISVLINMIFLLLIRYYLKNKPDLFKLSPTENNDNVSDFDWMRNHNLTEREREIILLIVKGNSNQEIGKQLFISANTVKNHIYNIYKKLGVKSRYELMGVMIPVKDDKT